MPLYTKVFYLRGHPSYVNVTAYSVEAAKIVFAEHYRSLLKSHRPQEIKEGSITKKVPKKENEPIQLGLFTI